MTFHPLWFDPFPLIEARLEFFFSSLFIFSFYLSSFYFPSSTSFKKPPSPTHIAQLLHDFLFFSTTPLFDFRCPPPPFPDLSPLPPPLPPNARGRFISSQPSLDPLKSDPELTLFIDLYLPSHSIIRLRPLSPAIYFVVQVRSNRASGPKETLIWMSWTAILVPCAAHLIEAALGPSPKPSLFCAFCCIPIL